MLTAKKNLFSRKFKELLQSSKNNGENHGKGEAIPVSMSCHCFCHLFFVPNI